MVQKKNMFRVWEASRFLILTITVLYITVFFNINKLAQSTLSIFLGDIVYVFIIVWMLFSVISFSRIIFLLFTAFFVVCNTLAIYFNIIYGIDIDFNLVMSVLNTHLQEAKELFSYRLVAVILIFSILPLFILIKIRFKKISIKNFLKQQLIVFVSCVLLNLVMGIIYPKKEVRNDRNKLFTTYFPFNTNYLPLNYSYYLGKYLTLLKGDYTYKDLGELYAFSFKKDASSEPLHVVLVIGETARSENFSLNNYKRETNPLLSKEKNLVYFKDFISCYTGTIISVNCMLSNVSGSEIRNNVDYYLQNEIGSFIEIFNKFNFDTNFATASAYKPGDPIFHRVRNSQHIYLTATQRLAHNTFDDSLIPKVEDILHRKSTLHKDKLIILHTLGSHFRYSARYPKEFERWTPICSKNGNEDIQACSTQELINEYDNSILFTDYVLSETIKLFKDKNAILIYSSDHGESLGENGVYYHSGYFDSVPRQQIHIPTFIWFSGKFLENNDNKKKFLNAQKLVNKEMNHDYIFHSILDCAGISGEIIDKKLSFCSN